jgi:hypothetical protein
MKVGEAASRVVVPVYHTGQGQDERARTRPFPLLRGLDAAWSLVLNPHRKSGTRWWAAADVGQAGASAGTAHGQQKGSDGNRLGDSVGAQAPGTGECSRSAVSSHRGATGQRGSDSGDVLPGRMSPLRRFKGRGVVAGLVHPHAIDDAHPDVGQGAQRHTVRLAFCPFALIVIQRPGFLLCRSPGKLVQGVAQRFHAGEAFVRFGVIATLERHGRGSCQGLDGVSIGVAGTIIAPFGQPPWRQALACPRQRPPDLLVVMGQKKGVDGLVIAGNLLDHHQQLLDQGEHQARLGAHDDLTGHQLGTMQFLDNLGSHACRIGMVAGAARVAVISSSDAACLGQQIGVNLIGRGLRRLCAID